MYFTYEKTVRFASNGNYDTRKIFDFIVDLFSIEDIQDMIDALAAQAQTDALKEQASG